MNTETTPAVARQVQRRVGQHRHDGERMKPTSDFEYRNKKTGGIYVLLTQAIDCTNARDGTPVVVYAPKGDCARVFVRDEAEFNEKFELASVPLPRCSACGRLLHAGQCEK